MESKNRTFNLGRLVITPNALDTLQPEDVQATQLAAARTYAIALTQVTKEQRATRSRLDAVQQLLQ